MTTSYRVQLFWGQAATGPSEQYITPAVADAGELSAVVNNMLNNRIALLPGRVYVSGVRISPYGTKRLGQLFVEGGGKIGGLPANPSIRFNPNGGYVPEIDAAFLSRPDQVRACLETQIFFGAAQPAIKYLAGVPIGAISGEPATLNTNATPNWYAGVRNFYGGLVSNRWQVESTTVPVAPVNYRIGKLQLGPQTTPLLGLVCPTGGGVPTLTVGARIQVSGIRPAKFTRQPTLNGSWAVDSIDTTTRTDAFTVYLQGSSTINPSINRTTMSSSFKIPTKQLATIVGFNPQRGAVHQRGKPGLSPRGRRLSRPTLDP